MIPISENVIQPKIKSNIKYVNSLEEFEKIELKPNETMLAFDNNQPFFYVRNYNNQTVIFCYEKFQDRVDNLKKTEFVEKCRKAGLDEFKSECAIKFFIEGWKPQQVWLWALSEKKKDIEWDTITQLKYRLKCILFPELVKRKTTKK